MYIVEKKIAIKEKEAKHALNAAKIEKQNSEKRKPIRFKNLVNSVSEVILKLGIESKH